MRTAEASMLLASKDVFYCKEVKYNSSYLGLEGDLAFLSDRKASHIKPLTLSDNELIDHKAKLYV